LYSFIINEIQFICCSVLKEKFFTFSSLILIYCSVPPLENSIFYQLWKIWDEKSDRNYSLVKRYDMITLNLSVRNNHSYLLKKWSCSNSLCFPFEKNPLFLSLLAHNSMKKSQKQNIFLICQFVTEYAYQLAVWDSSPDFDLLQCSSIGKLDSLSALKIWD